MTEVDVDRLPPTQYLILEVLAARYRLGEQWWTFPNRLRPAARALEQAKLVNIWSGQVEHTFRAILTVAGRQAVVVDRYVPPDQRALQLIADRVFGVDPVDVADEERIPFGAIRAALHYGAGWWQYPGSQWWQEAIRRGEELLNRLA